MWLQLYQHQERQCAGGQQEPLEKQRGDEDEIRNTHTPSPVHPDTHYNTQREVVRTGQEMKDKRDENLRKSEEDCVCISHYICKLLFQTKLRPTRETHLKP